MSRETLIRQRFYGYHSESNKKLGLYIACKESYLILLTAMTRPAFLNSILLTAPKFPRPISPQSMRSSAQKLYSSFSNLSLPVD